MYMGADNQLDTELIEKNWQVPGVLEARQRPRYMTEAAYESV